MEKETLKSSNYFKLIKNNNLLNFLKQIKINSIEKYELIYSLSENVYSININKIKINYDNKTEAIADFLNCYLCLKDMYSLKASVLYNKFYLYTNEQFNEAYGTSISEDMNNLNDIGDHIESEIGNIFYISHNDNDIIDDIKENDRDIEVFDLVCLLPQCIFMAIE